MFSHLFHSGVGSLLLLGSSLLLSGCFAAAVVNAEKGEDIDYYLKTNEVDPRIRKAMEDRQIVEGMTYAQVRLIMGAKPDFASTPDSKKQTERGEVWKYQSSDPMMPTIYRISFRDKRVVKHEKR